MKIKPLLFMTGVLLFFVRAGIAEIVVEEKVDLPVQAVIKVDAKEVAGVCDKYCWQEARVLEIKENNIDQIIPQVIHIASYSWDKGAPKGISVVSLRKYPGTTDLWILVNQTEKK